jgi:uncharacterized phage protein (predicted DNA packaging)
MSLDVATVRRRLHIDDGIDSDDDLNALLEQAKSSIIHSVDSTVDESVYLAEPLFERAVMLLFANWYFNNVPVVFGVPTVMPFSVNMVITQLKGIILGSAADGSN